MNPKIKKKLNADLIYPELSYKIVGLLYDVHNELGGGLREKAYEQAVAFALKKENITYEEQLLIPVKYKDEKVANRFLDFLIDNKIILEIKAGERFTSAFLRQTSEYLKTANYKLGLLVNFGRDRVTVKRVVNK